MPQFIVINEDFNCQNCGEYNSKSDQSCRNHCKKCLYSLHLDDKFPGDRASNCQNLMKPIGLDKSGKKGWMIYHKCAKCGKIITNKSAPDDNLEELIKLSHYGEQTRIKKNRTQKYRHS